MRILIPENRAVLTVALLFTLFLAAHSQSTTSEMQDTLAGCPYELECVEMLDIILETDSVTGEDSYFLSYDDLHQDLTELCPDAGIQYEYSSFLGEEQEDGIQFDCTDLINGTTFIYVTASSPTAHISCRSFLKVSLASTDQCDNAINDYVYLENLSASSSIGDTIAVAVKAGIDDLVLAFQTYYNWDADKFQFAGLDFTGTPFSGFSTENYSVQIADPHLAKLSVAWFASDYQGIELQEDTVLFSIMLEVTACGESLIDIVPLNFLDTEILGIQNQDIYEISVVEIGEVLDVSCDTLIDVNDSDENTVSEDSIVLRMPEMTFMPGDTSCIPVIIDNYSDAVSMFFPISFDPELLSLIGFQNLTNLLPSFNETAFGPAREGDGFDSFRVLYIHSQLNEQTLPDSTILFEVCFTPVPTIVEATCSEIGFEDAIYGTGFIEFSSFEVELIPYQLIPGQASIASNLQPTLCEGESIMINNQLYDQSYPQGTELIPGTSCDSTFMVNLQFLPNDTTVIEAEIAPGEAFQVGNETFTQAGDYEVLLTNRHGCDSLVYLNLDVLTAAEEATSTLSLGGLSLQQLLDDAPTRFPENELRLFDALGRQVYYAQPYDGRPLNITTLPSGVYYYTFRPAVGKREVLRGATVIAR